MTLRVYQGRYFARLFFLPVTSGDADGDVLGAVYRDEGESAWRFWYRFRWYRDARVFESEDQKTFYEGTASADLGETLTAMRAALGVLVARGPFEEIVVDSADPEIVITLLGEQPWATVERDGEARA
ncbi:MAG TPA: hypothetical protein VGB13_04580 [Candidatus Krumholzibacteria bacterium]